MCLQMLYTTIMKWLSWYHGIVYFRRVWQYVEMLTEDLKELTPYVQGHIDLVKKLLKKPPGKR